MRKFLNVAPYLLLLFIFFLVYKSWFFPGLITAGDFWPYAKSLYETRPLFLSAWDLASAGGMGGFVGPLLWVYLNFGLSITFFGKFLGLEWNLVERIFYLFPFLLISFFSSYKLFTQIFSKNIFSFLAIFVFSFNTYILMVVGGGQIAGVAMAYALSPLVFYTFIKTFKNLDKNYIKIIGFSIITSLLLSVQIVFDLRIAYITLFAVFVLWLLKVFENKNKKYFLKSVLFIFIIPAALALLLNAFWIIPTIANQKNPIEQLGPAYSSLEAVKFFSFAKFEDAISLLHPNWPENIFGKVGFLKPEFLMLPILAFSSLFFISKTKDLRTKRYVLFFALIGLIGAFLAKGANEPFGGIYLWLFENIPGFQMFRDPTKWYTLVAVSYSILIPFTVWKIYEFIKRKAENLKPKTLGNLLPKLFIILVIGYLLFLIRPALLGQLTGTFKSTRIPNEYIVLEKYLSSQDIFFRTLWYPTKQRFGFYSNIHPAIPAQDFYKTVDYSQILEKIRTTEGEKLLQESGVKYVIIPYDSQGEIFIKDRKYNNDIYQKTINEVKQIPYLKQISGFGKIAVFEIPNPKDHFWSDSGNLTLNYQYISPVEYVIQVKNAKKGDVVVFAESYDARWVASTVSGINYQVSSTKYEERFNSFVLSQDGNYTLNIYYYPQKYVEIGSVVSLVTFITVILFLIFSFKRSKNK